MLFADKVIEFFVYKIYIKIKGQNIMLLYLTSGFLPKNSMEFSSLSIKEHCIAIFQNP